MLRHLNLQTPAAAQTAIGRTVIENVSRRGFLKGTAAFAVAVQFLPYGEAEAFESYRAGSTCRTAWSTTRWCSSPSTATVP